MTKALVLGLLVGLSMTACNSDGGSSSNAGPGVVEKSAGAQFQGTFFGEEINQYLESKDKEFICNHIEKNGDMDSLTIDAVTIDNQGVVTDLELDSKAPAVIVAKLNAQGVAYEIFPSTDQNGVTCDDCKKIQGMTATMPTPTSISFNWSVKQDDGSIGQGATTYTKVSDADLASIKSDFKSCQAGH